jgi:hypothetical protein
MVMAGISGSPLGTLTTSHLPVMGVVGAYFSVQAIHSMAKDPEEKFRFNPGPPSISKVEMC